MNLKTPAVSLAQQKVGTLLDAAAHPLTSAEIMTALHWSKTRTDVVLRRMTSAGMVHRIPGEAKPGEGRGRPAALYWRREFVSCRRKPVVFDPDTIVIVPSDREARVLAMRGEYAELELLNEPVRADARLALHASLLRAFVPGRERPAPVRVSVATPQDMGP